MFNSPFSDNSSPSVGGWGDPTNDYRIYTGGFKDQIRAYLSPHHPKRDFSPFPFSDPEIISPFADCLAAPPLPVDLFGSHDQPSRTWIIWRMTLIGSQAYAPPSSTAIFMVAVYRNPDLGCDGHRGRCALPRLCLVSTDTLKSLGLFSLSVHLVRKASVRL